jgi:Carboxypeptidase regulatory-like domain
MDMRADVRNLTLLIALVAAVVALGIWGLGVSGPDAGDLAPTDPLRGHAKKDPREAVGGTETPILVGDAGISVLVRDSTGAPLAAATVEGFANGTTTGLDRAERDARIVSDPVPAVGQETDAEGRVRFEGLAAGSWTFRAHKDGYAREGGTRTLASDETTAELVLHLGEAHTLTGRVLDTKGNLLTGSLVMAARPRGGRSLTGAPLLARSRADEEGRFTLSRLSSGDHALLVAIEGVSPVPLITVRIPDVREIDLVLPLGGILTGVVSDQISGKPVEGASVVAMHWSVGGSATTTATTDAEGRYRFDPLPFESLSSLSVEADGYMYPAGGRPTGLGVPSGKTVEFDLALVPGAGLTGLVEGPDGPVAKARVTVHFVIPGSGWSMRKSAVSDAEGKYAVAGLPSGVAGVQVVVPGLYQPEAPIQWDEALKIAEKGGRYLVEIPEEGEASLDVSLLRGSTVEGKVLTPDDKGVVGARVYATGSGGRATSGDDGAFVLEGVAPGPAVALRATLTGYVLQVGKPIEVAEGRSVRDAEIRLTPAAIVRGRVTSKDGKPLRDVRVTTQASSSAALRSTIGSTRMLKPVDADGRYEVSVSRISGAFVVLATAVGRAPAVSEAVGIVEGQSAYEVDLTLGAGGDLAGRVVANGEPIPGATIGLNLAPSASTYRGSPRRAHPVVAVTDAEGRFSIATVPEGRIEISIRAYGYADLWERLDVPQSSEPTLEMKPALGLSGTVRWVDGTLAAGIPLQVMPEGGMIPSYQSWLHRTVSLADGSFAVANLPEGRYTVNVASRMFGGTANVQDVVSAPVEAGATDVRVIVEQGGIIAGKVVDGEGRPVPMASVHAQAKLDKRQYSYRLGQTDGEGRFRLVGLALVPQKLTISSTGNRGNSLRLPVVMNDVVVGTLDLEVVLTAGPTIEGTLKDEDGQLIPNARIGARRIQEGDRRRPNQHWQNGVVVDVSGAFRITGLEAGAYRLHLTSYGQSGQRSWKLIGGDRVEAGTHGLRLTGVRGGIIAGRVNDAAGKPLERAWVHASRGESSARTTTGPDGRFELQGLDDQGSYTVSVSRQGWKAINRKGVTPGTTNLTFVLDKGRRVTGRLVDEDGKPITGAHLNFSGRDQGRSLASGSTMTDEKGRFEVGGLDEGTYTVQGWARSKRTMRRLKLGTVRAGTLDVELRAPR